jgi:hypothetical protein
LIDRRDKFNSEPTSETDAGTGIKSERESQKSEKEISSQMESHGSITYKWKDKYNNKNKDENNYYKDKYKYDEEYKDNNHYHDGNEYYYE